MGSCEPLFLQMHPNLVPQLKLVRNSMLVVSLLVFSISFFQNSMDFLSDMLNLTPGEPLALVKKLPGFDRSIELDALLASDLHLCIHDHINGSLFQASQVEFFLFQLLCYI